MLRARIARPGRFLQKTNIVRDFLEDFVDGRTWWPKEVWGEYVDELGQLAEPVHAEQVPPDASHSHQVFITVVRNLMVRY